MGAGVVGWWGWGVVWRGALAEHWAVCLLTAGVRVEGPGSGLPGWGRSAAVAAAHRLKVDTEAKVVLDVGGDAVVADHREGEREQLPTVRRVSQRLRVADHGRVEDHLTRDRALSAKGEALQPRAVTQHEDRLCPG